ncbi:MAG TPA: hypothetical protein VLC48_04695, partial [Gemmatimonadota bacterium]|nr:hypothetical protein [Gemmatimonadota bacterium]
MDRLKTLIAEVHRRSLWQLLASYIVGAWLVLQIAETLASLIGLPLWFGAGVIALLAFGLVLVLTTGLVQVVAAYRSDPDRSYSGLRRLFSWKHALITGLVALALLMVGTGGYMGLRAMGVGPMGSLVAKGVLEPGERIVLADFQSPTGDSVLAFTVTDALRTDLSQSRVLRVAEPAYVRLVLDRMERDSDVALDEALAREVAVRQGLRAVIAGQVSAVGAGYVISARMVAPETGEAIDGWRETARDSTELTDAIDRLSKGMRERAGESLRAIRRSEPLAQVTTGSLEALKKYSEGERLFNSFTDRGRAIALLEEAVELDPNFASAHRRLGAIYSNWGRRAESVAATTRAYELRDRVTEAERYAIIGFYHQDVTGDSDQAFDAYRTLVEISDSTDVSALNNLGALHAGFRDYETAVRLSQRALLVNDSLGSNQYFNLFAYQVVLGKLDEARLTGERWLEKLGPSGSAYSLLVDLAAYTGDYATAEAHIRARAELGDTPTQRLESQQVARGERANLALLRGRLADARRQYREALDNTAELGWSEIWSGARIALLDVWFGADPAASTRILEDVLARHPLSEVEPLDRPYLMLARVYALSGQPERAGAMLEEYETTIDPGRWERGGLEYPEYQTTAGAVALAEG